jgi:hypothetical protein
MFEVWMFFFQMHWMVLDGVVFQRIPVAGEVCLATNSNLTPTQAASPVWCFVFPFFPSRLAIGCRC